MKVREWSEYHKIWGVFDLDSKFSPSSEIYSKLHGLDRHLGNPYLRGGNPHSPHPQEGQVRLDQGGK